MSPSLENGADPNLINDRKESALFYAKSENIAKLLLGYGADPNLTNNIKRTPLFYARPLVDTFKMYLCADTATFCQMYLCTDTIQYQYFSKVYDNDTFSINFWP